MNWTDLTVAGIPTAALIVAAVKICTGAGMPSKWAPLVACGIGILAGLAAEVTSLDYAWANWIDAALVGLWIGLGAVGGHAAVTHTSDALRERNTDEFGS